MRLLVGYNITDRAYAYMKEKNFEGLYRDSFEFDSIKVFDLDDFSFYDIGLREYAENKLEIVGCNVEYDKYLYGCDYSEVTIRGAITYHSDSMTFYSSEFNRECSPLFYKDKLIPVTGSCNRYLTYSNKEYNIIIELDTLNFEITAYYFSVCKSGTLSEYYVNFGFSLRIDRELKEVLSRLVSEEGNIVYVGDTLAICGKCSSSSKDSILKNGVKYVYIVVRAREQVLIIPPTVEEIRINCNWWHYLDKLNYIKLILPKVKLASLVSKLAKEIDLSKFGYLVTLEEKIEALRKTYVLIETYG